MTGLGQVKCITVMKTVLRTKRLCPYGTYGAYGTYGTYGAYGTYGSYGTYSTIGTIGRGWPIAVVAE